MEGFQAEEWHHWLRLFKKIETSFWLPHERGGAWGGLRCCEKEAQGLGHILEVDATGLLTDQIQGVRGRNGG